MNRFLQGALFFIIFSSSALHAQTYCTGGPSSTADSNLGEVTLSGASSSINNPTLCPGSLGVQLFLNEEADLILSETYTLTALFGTCGGSFSGAGQAWIDYNNNGTFEPSESIGTWVGTPPATASFNFTVPPTATVGKTRMRVMHQEFGAIPLNPCATFTWGGVKDFGIDILDPAILNAAMLMSSSPGAVCEGREEVFATFQNAGSFTINSLDLNWVLHSTSGAPVSNTYNWTGTLLPGQTITDLPIGSFPNGFTNGDQLTVFTSNPNGIPDSVNTDDTVKYTLRTGFSGVFKVGGANPDFFDVRDAARYLDSLGAICDTVIFDIRDGDYFGRWTIGEIGNAYFDRPIIFRSESGNAAAVRIIDSTSNNTASNFVGNLNGVDHIFFENLTFRNQSPNANFKRVIRIGNSSDYVNFEGCRFENNLSPTSNSTNINCALVFSDSASICYSNTFRNNEFFGSNYGLLWLGGTVEIPGGGMSIIGNTFQNQSVCGARIFNEQGLLFSHNHISSNNSSGVTASFGFDGRNLSRGVVISDNKIIAQTNWPRTGMRIASRGPRSLISGNIPGQRSVIANNFIKVGIDSVNIQFRAAHFESLAFFNVIHNTIAVFGTNQNNVAALIDRGGSNNVRNNIFANMGSGIGFRVDIENSHPFASETNNNYYSANGSFGEFDETAINNLQQWQNVTNGGVNSVNVDPLFYSNTDLHVCADALNNSGTPAQSTTFDIDGQLRSTKTPDIGADEFEGVNSFSIGEIVTICKGDSLFVNGSLNADATFSWTDNFPSAERWIHQEGTYSVTSTSFCGTASASLEVSFTTASVLGADTAVCAGIDLTLEAEVQNASFSWSNGATSKSITVNQSGLYYVDVLDSTNCLVRDSIRVIYSIPVSLPNDTSFCDGNNLFLTANSGSGTYLWNTNATTRSIWVNESGTYEVTHTSPDGCQSSDEVHIDVIPLPSANFVYSEVYGTIVFQNTSSPADDYIWDFGNGFFSNQENPVHVYSNDSSYLVTLSISNQCGSDFITQQISTTVASVQDLSFDNIKIYPNPSIDFILVEGAFNSQYQIQDLLGKAVSHGKIDFQIQSIPISDIMSGVYFLTVIKNGQSYTQKIIKL